MKLSESDVKYIRASKLSDKTLLLYEAFCLPNSTTLD